MTSTDQLFFNLIHLILQDYIKLAGGTSSATNDILLISPNGETSEIRNNFKIFGANKADIYPGSIIYVQGILIKLVV